jgi:hypothetical protein
MDYNLLFFLSFTTDKRTKKDRKNVLLFFIYYLFKNTTFVDEVFYNINFLNYNRSSLLSLYCMIWKECYVIQRKKYHAFYKSNDVPFNRE